MLNAVPRGPQVIQEHNLWNVEFSRERIRVDNPGKIRGANPIIEHRTRHAKSRGKNSVGREMRRSLPREFLYDQVKLSEFLAGKALAEDRGEITGTLRKEREIALGSADVACKDHRFPLCLSPEKTRLG
jgi:hypothetical protein